MSENIEITAAETDAATAQSDSPLPDDKDPLSLKVTLADLCARAAAQYAHRAYEVATDTYAQAAELQAEINGEMNPENAEVLFLYGRALFKLGQGKSTVLGGGGVTGPGAGTGAKGKAQADKVKDVLAGRVSAESASKGKGLVQLEDEDEEDEGDEGAQDEDEDQEADGQEAESDDLEAAFEALDLASVLFKRKLEALTADNRKDDNGKSAGKPSEEEPEQSADQDKDQEKNGIEQMTRHIKERLGDTHDLLAEIHLENERFPYAVDDCRQSLAHKLSVYTPEDPAIAEAHYKLSLALEFASLTPSSDEKSATASGDAPSKGYDEKLRAEAAEALEAAIASTRLKLQAKEGELAANANAAVDESNVTRAQIADVEEMIAEMEDRLADLHKPPQDLTSEIFNEAVAGFAKALGGKSMDEQEAILAEAQKGAVDLTSHVRRKRAEPKDDDDDAAAPGAKRKASQGSDKPDAEGGTESKKARVEDA